MEQAVPPCPAFVGLVASPARGEAVIGYLADRGVPPAARPGAGPGRARPRPTSHREIAVSILAELVQLRATGGFASRAASRPSSGRHREIDPVCGMTIVADAGSHPVEHEGVRTTSAAWAAGPFQTDPARYVRRTRRRDADQELVRRPPANGQGVGFFQDIPQVAACLPGAELTDDLGDDPYLGRVGVRMGPVKLQFAGKAHIVERDEAAKAARRRRGRSRREGPRTGLHGDRQLSPPAARGRPRAGLAALRRGRTVRPRHDLRRHRGPDAQFATNMQHRIEATERGEDPNQVVRVAPASGFAIGLRAMRMALNACSPASSSPTNPTRAEEASWCGGGSATVLLLVEVVPVLVALLNRVLAALERIRGDGRRHPRRRRRARPAEGEDVPETTGGHRCHRGRRVVRCGSGTPDPWRSCWGDVRKGGCLLSPWVTVVLSGPHHRRRRTRVWCGSSCTSRSIRHTLRSVVGGGDRWWPSRPARCPRCCPRSTRASSRSATSAKGCEGP